MQTETRLARVLDRLSAGTRVLGIREYDSQRAERNGEGRHVQLEEAVNKLEAAADELWNAIER